MFTIVMNYRHPLIMFAKLLTIDAPHIAHEDEINLEFKMWPTLQVCCFANVVVYTAGYCQRCSVIYSWWMRYSPLTNTWFSVSFARDLPENKQSNWQCLHSIIRFCTSKWNQSAFKASIYIKKSDNFDHFIQPISTMQVISVSDRSLFRSLCKINFTL